MHLCANTSQIGDRYTNIVVLNIIVVWHNLWTRPIGVGGEGRASPKLVPTYMASIIIIIITTMYLIVHLIRYMSMPFWVELRINRSTLPLLACLLALQRYICSALVLQRPDLAGQYGVAVRSVHLDVLGGERWCLLLTPLQR